ncbi:hypothetical protein M413DRAFT_33088 [Hebeloma cylindrosporum]|uniref:Uncharacterized protein n=1 Tax=Hebeloma cylindrosporum TaxID=76867 RepID=A0A0C3BRM7_HEBCY|nr:hypothetical protein M413DRAFT_33088 [Hebeloma cylindrosporum h7]
MVITYPSTALIRHCQPIRSRLNVYPPLGSEVGGLSEADEIECADRSDHLAPGNDKRSTTLSLVGPTSILYHIIAFDAGAVVIEANITPSSSSQGHTMAAQPRVRELYGDPVALARTNR